MQDHNYKMVQMDIEFFLFHNFFLAFDFCRFCVVIRVFFNPRHNGQ